MAWPYRHAAPSAPSFAVSPFHGQHHAADPFGFSQPFQSLFNDTFAQLDRLSADLDSHLSQAFDRSSDNSWQKLLTSTPKFDVQETEAAYILEGELPGLAKADISLDFVDDHTLVLKTQTSTFNQKPQLSEQQKPEISDIDSATGNSATEMSGAHINSDAAKNDDPTDAAVTKAANEGTDVAPAAIPKYHLTERTRSTFQRVFSFPGEVKHDEVKASLKNGVLTVTVPKLSPEPAKEEQKTRSVTIEDATETDDADMGDAEKAKL